MEKKTKFIVIGLVGFCIICLFLFIQASMQQKELLRQSDDLKTENTTLLNKVKQLETDLRGNQGRIDSLKAERDRVAAELNDLQARYESATKARDALIEKLKEKSRTPAVVSAPEPVKQPEAPMVQNNDAYWGSVLQAKKELEMQLADIRVELKNLQTINDALKKEKAKTELELQLETQLASVRSELKLLQINNETLQKEKGLLEIDINNMRSEKKDLLRQLDYNQKLLNSMSEEVARERNDKLTIQDNYQTIKTENGVLLRQLRTLVNRKAFLDKKVQDLQQGKSSIEKRLTETEKMLADKSSKIEALKNQLDAVKGGKATELDRESQEAVELPAIVVRSGSVADKGQAQIQEFPGKILAVNLESNFVVIDLGTSAGVEIGDIFNVYSDGQSIGTISVIQTRAGISACDIRKMSTPLKIGDSVKRAV